MIPAACSAGDSTRPINGSAATQGLTLVHFSAQPEPFLIQNRP